MKLFVNKKHKVFTLISTPIVALLFMALMPYGSFNAQNSGFWLSIACAVFVCLFTDLLIVKYQVPRSDKQSPDKDTKE